MDSIAASHSQNQAALDSLDMDTELDVVATSQPFEDGEEDLHWQSHPGPQCSPMLEPSLWEGTESGSEVPEPNYVRRARLVRRCPPLKSSPTKPSYHGSAGRSRARNLVRRCSSGPSESFLRARRLYWKRQEARTKAHRIVKQIQALATTTAQLRRKHRQLCAFLSGTVEM
ncbi:hypothetical protein B0H11DRAFT_1934252 [Mycena galericulata]|nr:hypothetical protein B0H11DRAFT_1934252 [Mycena galericulata]